MHKGNELIIDKLANQLDELGVRRFPSSWGIDWLTEGLAEICNTEFAMVVVKNGPEKFFLSTFDKSEYEVSLDLSVLEELLHDPALAEVRSSNETPHLGALELIANRSELVHFSGLALSTADGRRIGLLCVLDSKPNILNNVQKIAMEELTHSLALQLATRDKVDSNSVDEDLSIRDILHENYSKKPSLHVEQLFSQALDAIKDHISIIDESGCNIFVNKAWTDFSQEFSTDEHSELGLGSNYLQVCEKSAEAGSDDAAFVAAAIKAALSDSSFSVCRLEYPCHVANEDRWFVASISALSISSRKLVVISHHNVTRRKRAEIENIGLVDKLEIRVRERTVELERAYETLRNSEEKYRSIFRNSTVGFCITSLEGVCEEVNSAFCDLAGRKREELIGQKIDYVLFDQDAKVLEYLQSEVLSGRTANQVRDVRIKRPDKMHKWGRASVAAIFDGEGKPIQAMNLFQDFTLQKKAKKERDQVFEQSFDLFAIVEYNGEIFQANPACSRMFGVSSRHLPGKNIVDFTHPDDIPKVYAVLAAMQNEDSDLPSLDIRMGFRDGGYRDVRWTGTRHAEQAHLIVIGRDVTRSLSSKKALQRLASRLQQIREEERTRISREIHDELGQILTALKIDLDLLNRDVGVRKDEEIRLGIEEITVLVNSTLVSVKRIAQDLRPEVLDALGLVPALEWQAKETQNRAKLECKIVCKTEMPDLNSDQTTQLFRIIQEALTNVVRHAEATKVEVIIDVDTEGFLKIKIQDNGKGFHVQDLEFQSLGLLGMQERARNIDAELAILSSPKKGTTVKVTLFPIASYWDEKE